MVKGGEVALSSHFHCPSLSFSALEARNPFAHGEMSHESEPMVVDFHLGFKRSSETSRAPGLSKCHIATANLRVIASASTMSQLLKTQDISGYQDLPQLWMLKGWLRKEEQLQTEVFNRKIHITAATKHRPWQRLQHCLDSMFQDVQPAKRPRGVMPWSI